MGYLFENKSPDHVMTIKGQFVLKNMILRDAEPGKGNTVDYIVK